MSKVVCIVTYKEITDEAKLAAYAAMAPTTVQKYGGQFLARGYPVALRERYCCRHLGKHRCCFAVV